MAGPVRYVGDDGRGYPLFDVDLTWPDASRYDRPPTERMVDAIVDLFGDDFGVTNSQARAALAARDYARLCVQKIMPDQEANIKKLMSKLMAAFIMHDPSPLADVRAWSERRWDTGAANAVIVRTKRFDECEIWLLHLLAEMRSGAAATG